VSVGQRKVEAIKRQKKITQGVLVELFTDFVKKECIPAGQNYN
jgi:hypothetical protein